MKKSRKNKTFKAYEKILRDDKDFDYSYLLILERKKLQRMYDYFENSKISLENPRVASEISICLRLIDIIMEEDPVSLEYQRRISESSSSNYTTTKLSDGTYRLDLNSDNEEVVTVFPRYVNSRNESRFNPKIPLTMAMLEKSLNPGSPHNSRMVEWQKDNLRRIKAVHLYNKIRAYKIFNWWD